MNTATTNNIIGMVFVICMVPAVRLYGQGDIKGIAYDASQSKEAVLDGATVTFKPDKEGMERSQETDGDGKFHLEKCPPGRGKMNGVFENYSFFPIEVDIEDGKEAERDMPAMPADPDAVTKWSTTTIDMYFNPEIGVAAMWQKLSQFNPPMEIRSDVARELVSLKSIPVSLEVKMYAGLDPADNQSAVLQYAKFFDDPRGARPDLNVPREIELEIIDSMLRRVKDDEQLESIRKALTRLEVRGLDEYVKMRDIPGRLLATTWDSTKGDRNLLLKFYGESGICLNSDRVPVGTFSNVACFNYQERWNLAGFYKIDDETGWFSLNFSSSSEFAGTWGRSEKIGQEEGNKWVGKKAQD